MERLRAVIDFELFRPDLEAALARGDRSRGGRPPCDAVLIFRILMLQTLYTLSDDQTDCQRRDRLPFMRFAGLALADAVPDAKTIWLLREQLTRAGALSRLFARFDARLRGRGYLAMGGATRGSSNAQHCWNSCGGGRSWTRPWWQARRPHLSKDEKQAVRDGGNPSGWSKERTRQIDRDGLWTIKRGRKAPPPEGAQRQAVSGIAVPVFGYKNNIGIDRAQASSAASPSPTRRGTTAASSPPRSIPPTPPATCERIPPIAARRS